jgi:hypothetical protein
MSADRGNTKVSVSAPNQLKFVVQQFGNWLGSPWRERYFLTFFPVFRPVDILMSNQVSADLIR